MAKGHRSQIKRARNAEKDTETFRKAVLRKSFCSESMLMY